MKSQKDSLLINVKDSLSLHQTLRGMLKLRLVILGQENQASGQHSIHKDSEMQYMKVICVLLWTEMIIIFSEIRMCLKLLTMPKLRKIAMRYYIALNSIEWTKESQAQRILTSVVTSFGGLCCKW